jgi:pimeloyl-ACP methyl ester carboxylesterase
MGAEGVVVGRVANGRGQWAAQGEVVVDKQAPPWGHDHTDCFGERLGFAERTLEIVEEVSERDIDRLGHELRLAAREEAAERAAGSARFVRHYPEQNPMLRDLLPTISTPTQIVAGRDDDLVPSSNNQYLHDLLPNSEIHPLDAGHFAWEQAAEEYGYLVVDWVSGRYRRLAGG